VRAELKIDTKEESRGIALNSEMSCKTIFDQIAEDYDKVRPGYPQELIRDIISISRISEDGRILEIGCGTGQATIPFAKYGYSITCLEIGKRLASLAAKNCQKYPNVHIHPVSFEEWKNEMNSFDLVMSATAFHWIPPEIAYPKAAQILKESGYIAIFSSFHPTPYTGFFQTVQKVYRNIVPEWKDPTSEPSMEDKIRSREDYINGTALFEKVLVKQYPWEKEYKTEQYIKLLNTYSAHRCLDKGRREKLFSNITDLINEKYGGIITRPYLTVLYIAKKVS